MITEIAEFKIRPEDRTVRIPRDGGHDSMLMADSVPA